METSCGQQLASYAPRTTFLAPRSTLDSQTRDSSRLGRKGNTKRPTARAILSQMRGRRRNKSHRSALTRKRCTKVAVSRLIFRATSNHDHDKRTVRGTAVRCPSHRRHIQSASHACPLTNQTQGFGRQFIAPKRESATHSSQKMQKRQRSPGPKKRGMSMHPCRIGNWGQSVEVASFETANYPLWVSLSRYSQPHRLRNRTPVPRSSGTAVSSVGATTKISHWSRQLAMPRSNCSRVLKEAAASSLVE